MGKSITLQEKRKTTFLLANWSWDLEKSDLKGSLDTPGKTPIILEEDADTPSDRQSRTCGFQRRKRIFRITPFLGKRLAGGQKILKTAAGPALGTKEKYLVC